MGAASLVAMPEIIAFNAKQNKNSKLTNHTEHQIITPRFDHISLVNHPKNNNQTG